MENIEALFDPNLNKKHQKLILALLTEPTNVAAAAKAGISERALYQAMRDPVFMEAYRAVRRRVYEKAIGDIQGMASEAVLILLSLAKNAEPDSARIGAAKAILELGAKGIETNDLIEKVEQLERGRKDES